jgi:PAS domain S-box-containing protein
MAARTETPEDVALSLTMAVVSASPGPLLLLDGGLHVVGASASFCDAFGLDRDQLIGRPFFAVGAGEWDRPQLRSLMEATVSGAATIDAYELDIARPHHATRRLIVQARRLDYLDLANLRVLVAVSDVTEARKDERLKDEAIRQNTVLLQEVRHRVANSLQIIASVLMQNARKTQSDETRAHLHDAHHRVMSVAAMERLLSISEDGDVAVQSYFRRLCESIAASMIGDPERISLSVGGGEGVVDARVSVSLGLIVTELVINALKHAFPDGRAGAIVVDYEFKGPNWTLSVSDDGVGMPTDSALIRTGLGTSIVEALARQLEATVRSAPAHPGTKVSIEHTPIALVVDGPRLADGSRAALRPAV